MKKIYSILLAALAVCAVSCQEGPLDTTEPDTPETPETGETMTFTASLTPTKTTLNGDKSLWLKGDEITINGVTLKAVLPDGKEMSETATFTGVVTPKSDSPKYVASYGHFSANQKAVANNYDPSVVTLTATSDDHNLYFTNTTALLKFNVAEEGVNKVSFVGKTENGTETITLNAEKGTLSGEYYMAVEPKSYTDFDIKFGDSEIVKTYINPAPFKPTASKIIDLGNLQICKWYLNIGISGQDDSWKQPKFIDAGNYYVVENVKTKDNTKFSFNDGKGIWYHINEFWVNSFRFFNGLGDDSINEGIYNFYLTKDFKKAIVAEPGFKFCDVYLGGNLDQYDLVFSDGQKFLRDGIVKINGTDYTHWGIAVNCQDSDTFTFTFKNSGWDGVTTEQSYQLKDEMFFDYNGGTPILK